MRKVLLPVFGLLLLVLAFGGNASAQISDPFYLIVASAVYTGSTNSPTVGSTATMYSPYPGGTTSSVSVGGAVLQGEMTSGDIYTFLGLGSKITNSFNFGNMVACDTGRASCANSGLLGSGAPLFGDTITGFDITTSRSAPPPFRRRICRTSPASFPSVPTSRQLV